MKNVLPFKCRVDGRFLPHFCHIHTHTPPPRKKGTRLEGKALILIHGTQPGNDVWVRRSSATGYHSSILSGLFINISMINCFPKYGYPQKVGHAPEKWWTAFTSGTKRNEKKNKQKCRMWWRCIVRYVGIFRWGAQAAPIENDLSDGTGGHAHDARVSYLGGTRKKVADALLYPPTEGFAPETFRINHEQEVDNTRQTIGKETGATSSWSFRNSSKSIVDSNGPKDETTLMEREGSNRNSARRRAGGWTYEILKDL